MQLIVHVDMDAFYANVELLDNPGLAGKAFGVCPVFIGSQVLSIDYTIGRAWRTDYRIL
jgi:nucleotidyltransferase/DNA polymerase involved in DNA repair